MKRNITTLIFILSMLLGSPVMASVRLDHPFDPYVGSYEIFQCFVLEGLPWSCQTAGWGYEKVHITFSRNGYHLVFDGSEKRKIVPIKESSQEKTGDTTVSTKVGVEDDGTSYLMKVTSQKTLGGPHETDLEVYKIKQLDPKTTRLYFIKSMTMNGLEVVGTTILMDLRKN